MITHGYGVHTGAQSDIPYQTGTLLLWTVRGKKDVEILISMLRGKESDALFIIEAFSGWLVQGLASFIIFKLLLGLD